MKMTWRDFRAAYDFICNSCGYYLWEKKKSVNNVVQKIQ